MMRSMRLGLLAAAALLPLAACQQPAPMAVAAPPPPVAPPAPMISQQDAMFLNAAAESGMAEVQMGQLAQTKSVPRAVHGFADRMVTDHTKVNDQLMQLAQSVAFTPTTTLTPADQDAAAHLQNLNGRVFVRAYGENQVHSHIMAIQVFQQEAQNGNNPQIKAFAAQTLPILRQHLAMARRVFGIRG